VNTAGHPQVITSQAMLCTPIYEPTTAVRDQEDDAAGAHTVIGSSFASLSAIRFCAARQQCESSVECAAFGGICSTSDAPAAGTIMYRGEPMTTISFDDTITIGSRNHNWKRYNRGAGWPSELQLELPMLGTRSINTGNSHELILPSRTTVYMLRRTDWSYVDVRGWEAVGPTRPYFTYPDFHAQLYMKVFEAGTHYLDDYSAMYFFHQTQMGTCWIPDAPPPPSSPPSPPPPSPPPPSLPPSPSPPSPPSPPPPSPAAPVHQHTPRPTDCLNGKCHGEGTPVPTPHSHSPHTHSPHTHSPHSHSPHNHAPNTDCYQGKCYGSGR